MSLLQKLQQWRSDQARKEGVELYRVFSNATLSAIGREKPADKAGLLSIKGIAEKKYQKYGEEILKIVQEDAERHPHKNEKSKEESDFWSLSQRQDTGVSRKERVHSVGSYLDFVNTVLQEMPSRVRGEVSSVDMRGNYLFYTIKDQDGQASLSVFMWANRYALCGVALEEGMEIIVEGHAEVYKPSGRFSFRAESVELVGEGALKVAYERLKARLKADGLFDVGRKRVLPNFPQRIGLITSRDGAVIHDFLNNIGRFGYAMRFVNSRVEGQLAVADLLGAVKRLKKEPLDVLVVIRGGGSLESLQAFNNETLVRELASFPVPVICGIGHDKDVPLVSMVADLAVSTPTAVTKVLNNSWEQLLTKIDIFERDLFGGFERTLYETRSVLQRDSQMLAQVFSHIVDRCRGAEVNLRQCSVALDHFMKGVHEYLKRVLQTLMVSMGDAVSYAYESMKNAEYRIEANDPHRQLRFGYSIVRSGEKVVRSVKEVKVGDEVSVLLAEGSMNTIIKKLSNDKE